MGSRGTTFDGSLISLFPFLSILSCVIGTLTLLIAGLTAGAMSAGSVNAEEYVRLEAERAQMEQESSETEQLLTQALALAQKLREVREQLEVLELERQKAEKAEAATIELLSRIHDLEERKTELLAEIERMERELANLEQQIQELRDKRERARDSVVVQPPPDVPGVPRPDIRPYFVECLDTGIVLNVQHDDEQRIRVPDIPESKPLKDYFARVKADTKASVIFLIRPGGIKAYWAAENAAEKAGLRTGRLPIVGHKKLDLRLFEGL